VTPPQPTHADPEPLPVAPPEDVRRAQEERLLRTWRTPSGWRYWSSVNNSDVGLWYTGATFFFLLFGGLLALLMRIQLAVPDNDAISAELYNQAFTVHGSVMMFLFAIPVFEAIAVLFLPQLLGARDLLGVPDRRSIPRGLDLLRCGAARRMVHVSAADVEVPTRDRFRHLAPRVLLHRSRSNCRGHRDDRRHAQVPSAGDALEPDAALRVVRPGRGGDDPVRLSTADCRIAAARGRTRLSVAVLRSGRRR
jgi:hypothetical protein